MDKITEQYKKMKLSLEEQYILTENRIDFLKKTYKDKISTEHDQLATKKDSDSIIDHFAEHDPTEKKEYTQWMVGQYRKGHIRQEDAHSVGQTISAFHDNKKEIPTKDINSFKHVSDLRDAVEPFVKREESGSFADPKAAEEGTEKVYDEGGVKAFKIKNFEASRKMGSGTSWCTNEKSLYDSYTRGKDATHVIVTKEGEKFQLHHSTNQLKDYRDVELDSDNPTYEKYKDHIAKIVEKTAPPGGSDLKDRFGEVDQSRIDRIKKEHNSKWHYNRFREDYKKLSQNKNVKKEHIDQLVDHAEKTFDAPSTTDHKTFIHMHFGDNPGITENDIREFHSKVGHINNFVANKNAPADLLNKNFEEQGTWSPKTAYKMNKENLKKIVSRVENYGEHPLNLESHPDHKEIIAFGSPEFHDKFSGEAKKKENIDDYVSGKYRMTPSSKLFSNKNLKPEHLEAGYHKFRNDVNFGNYFGDKIAENPNTPSSVIKRMIDEDKHGHKLSNHALKRPEIIEHILNNAKRSETAVDSALNAGSFNQEQKHKLLDLGHHSVLRPDQGDTKELINKAYKLHETAYPGKPSEEHYKHLDQESLIRIAAKTPANIVEVLKGGKHKKVSGEVLNSLNSESAVPKSALEGIKRDVLKYVADKDTLNKVFEEGNHITKQRVLSHPEVSEELIQKHHEDPSFHGAISINPEIPPYIARSMAEGPLQNHVKENLLNNKNVPADVKEKLK